MSSIPCWRRNRHRGHLIRRRPLYHLHGNSMREISCCRISCEALVVAEISDGCTGYLSILKRLQLTNKEIFEEKLPLQQLSQLDNTCCTAAAPITCCALANLAHACIAAFMDGTLDTAVLLWTVKTTGITVFPQFFTSMRNTLTVLHYTVTS